MVRMTTKEAMILSDAKRRDGSLPKPLSETERQNIIREYLAWKGWEVTRHHQTLGSRKGFPDLTALKDGWTVYIEVKTDTGKLSQDQKSFRDSILPHGGTYVIARCLEDVDDLGTESVDVLRQRLKGKVIGRE